MGCLSVSLCEQRRESSTIPVMRMNPSAHDHHAQGNQPEALLHLSLAGLLPPDQKLVINPSMRAATLFSYTPEGEAQIVAQQQFSPNGMRVLIPLLQAYPNYCPYETLLAALFSLTLDEARRQLREIREIALRSVRRAIGSLVTGLRAFGLHVRSVRSTAIWWKPSPKRPLENRGARSKPCFSVKEHRRAKTMSREKTRHCSCKNAYFSEIFGR
jgi:hypothetical protein